MTYPSTFLLPYHVQHIPAFTDEAQFTDYLIHPRLTLDLSSLSFPFFSKSIFLECLLCLCLLELKPMFLLHKVLHSGSNGRMSIAGYLCKNRRSRHLIIRLFNSNASFQKIVSSCLEIFSVPYWFCFKSPFYSIQLLLSDYPGMWTEWLVLFSAHQDKFLT